MSDSTQSPIIRARLEMDGAIKIVADRTGTRKSFIRVIYEVVDGEWGWAVETVVRTFATPRGQRVIGRGTLKASGWSAESPEAAALACVQDIERMIADGRGITSGGRIEAAE